MIWPAMKPELDVHLYCIAHGGHWQEKGCAPAGNGKFYHFKKAIGLLWPDFIQHRWFDLFLENWLTHKYVGVLGPKNSGKTAGAAVIHLVDYYAFPSCTTVIVCSDTKENLEDRIWGEIKKRHRQARMEYDWLPGHLIEGRTRLVTDERNDGEEGRDFRNGFVGIPVKKGSAYASIGSFVGRKNKRVRICGDELSLLNKTFIDGTVSLTGQQDTKVTGLGNPSQTTDSLGLLCEPHTSLGGWDGGIDQTPKTKTWKTRWPNGIAIQFPGSDSPNNDFPQDEPPRYPFLMTREQMEEDAKIWGREDWHFTMFNEGRMPRGQGSNRIITRQICLKGRAMEEPIWRNSKCTIITALDAAYRSVGGDRCVFIVMEFGQEAEPMIDEHGTLNAAAIIRQDERPPSGRQLLALTDLMIVPIAASDFEDPEDQIVMFVKKQHEDRNIPPENHFYDSGMRTALVQTYARLWSNKVNSIDCGGRPTEREVSGDINVLAKDYYDRLITEFWYSMRLVVEAKQFRGMTEDLMLEGCAREFKRVAGNKIAVETKEEMKVKTGKSPDCFDAACIGLEGARRKGFVIKSLRAKEELVTDAGWRRELREKSKKFWKIGTLVES